MSDIYRYIRESWMMKKIVYVLGNPSVDSDALPLRLQPLLQKKFPMLSFIHLDPTEELSIDSHQELILIDTVVGIDKVIKFNDFTHWVLSPRVTLHDFDLPLSLGLMKKLGKLKNVTIIGVPVKGEKKYIIEEIANILNSI